MSAADLDGSGAELVVVGAGFGRTGTRSMQLALDRLGLGPTHHMFEAFAHPEHFPLWADAVAGRDWDPAVVLSGYRSAVDFPSAVVWEQLWRANPNSTVLLTTRPAAQWWASFDATIGPSIREGAAGDDAHAGLFAAIDQHVFGGRTDDRDAAIAAFEAHERHVIDTVPPERLLVHRVGDGWEPLCEHFALPVPDEAYPSTNSSQEWRRNHEDR